MTREMRPSPSQRLKAPPPRASAGTGMACRARALIGWSFLSIFFTFCGSRPNTVPTGSGTRYKYINFPRSIGLVYPKWRERKWVTNRGSAGGTTRLTSTTYSYTLAFLYSRRMYVHSRRGKLPRVDGRSNGVGCKHFTTQPHLVRLGNIPLGASKKGKC